MSEDNEVLGPVTYTTKAGITIGINSIPVFLIDDITAAVDLPERPTYTATLPGGEEEIHPHDETTVETEEEKRAWSNYVEALNKASREQNSRLMKVLMLKGVEVDMESEDVLDWLEEMEYLEVPLPESKLALKVKYVETRVMSSIDDLVIIMKMIMEQSGVPKEAVDKAVASFQSAIQRAASLLSSP